MAFPIKYILIFVFEFVQNFWNELGEQKSSLDFASSKGNLWTSLYRNTFQGAQNLKRSVIV